MKLARFSDVGALDARYAGEQWSIRRSAFFILGCSAIAWMLVVYGIISLL